MLAFTVASKIGFQGNLSFTGTHFNGTFKHVCRYGNSTCAGLINVPIQAGYQIVCLTAITSDASGRFSTCKEVGVVGPLGKLELYLETGNRVVAVNREVRLRTKALEGGYDPRLNYTISFGDKNSQPVSGMSLSDKVVFTHIYQDRGNVEVKLNIGGETLKLPLAVYYGIDNIRFILPNGRITRVGGTLRVIARFESFLPAKVNLEFQNGTRLFTGNGEFLL